MEMTLRYCEADIYLTGLIKWIKAVFMTDQLNEFVYQVWVPLAQVLFPFEDRQRNFFSHALAINSVAGHGIPGVGNGYYTGIFRGVTGQYPRNGWIFPGERGYQRSASGVL